MMLNGRYGEVETLDLETKDNKVALQLKLNGENDLVDISSHYEIDDQDPEAPVIILSDLQVSRQWMQELASDNVEGKEIELPEKLAPVVKMIL